MTILLSLCPIVSIVSIDQVVVGSAVFVSIAQFVVGSAVVVDEFLEPKKI